jgi:hypothetical protein
VAWLCTNAPPCCVHSQIGTHVLTGVISIHTLASKQKKKNPYANGRCSKRRATTLFLATICIRLYCRAVPPPADSGTNTAVELSRHLRTAFAWFHPPAITTSAHNRPQESYQNERFQYYIPMPRRDCFPLRSRDVEPYCSSSESLPDRYDILRTTGAMMSAGSPLSMWFLSSIISGPRSMVQPRSQTRRPHRMHMPTGLVPQGH